MKNVLSYIEQTESYLKENKDNIPKGVYDFVNEVCKQERQVLDMAKRWAEQKALYKVKPEDQKALYTKAEPV